jgi:hypothetical protein
VDVTSLWPRRRSTGAALLALLIVQSVLFFAVAQRSYFFHDDYGYFLLAEQRHPLRYLLTPILAQYPAPGDRLLSLVLHELAPLNFAAACAILLTFLAGTTVILRELVGRLARSDQWWTVALLVPFALSLTLVLPVSWWSAGLPILPCLFFTAVSISAFVRSYTEPAKVRTWIAVTAIAIAAASAFYMKFLLIPIYLLLFRLVVLPRLIDLPGSIRQLWTERMRWIALALPAVVFIAVFSAYYITGRLSWLEVSAGPGYSRPYLEYFTTAWFRGFVPASFVNARLAGSGPAIPDWALIVGSHVILFGMVATTWRRSALAARAWLLFILVFAVNVAMVGTQRLPGYGVDIAYWLRYYPEITLFLPVVLALGLRQGAERHPELAWERTSVGRTAIVMLVGLYVASFILWAPGIVHDSPGAQARSWYETLRRDIQEATLDGRALRLVDAATPEYVLEKWTAPENRVSTILSLAGLNLTYNAVSEHVHVVGRNGGLAEAAFRPLTTLVADGMPSDEVRVVRDGRVSPDETCLEDSGSLLYRPSAELTGERLAVRVFYVQDGSGPVAVGVDTGDPDESSYLELHRFQSEGELADLGTSRLRTLTLATQPGDRICIERMEIGTLIQRSP